LYDINIILTGRVWYPKRSYFQGKRGKLWSFTHKSGDGDVLIEMADKDESGI
jgi:hypothetical protein